MDLRGRVAVVPVAAADDEASSGSDHPPVVPISREPRAFNGVQMVLDLTVEIDGSRKPACVARAGYGHYT
jgi:hypothetical protein